ncbi:sugar (Glycoside-Pentoside-Hexuronide) transporter [Propionispira arboris]|uniref:Sugar (Glycoside-Pentoside-Hexuronide) transporter n=1 Tax=Propionispira arboris TaxID=84035 RepID=A0A1H6YXJ8_9FIRM|nr:MFS transporter [Propionispira arboris]SEJ45948.1 sugar (Glycoside-Pentoside-Hexuronide) transporter [Propionispira arboris]
MAEKKISFIKVPLRGRLGYALTDASGNLLYCIIGAYLLYFLTDVYGLSIAVTGTLLLATRLLDAVDAPVWGFIVDHTKSKYGQSRPYFMWLAIPFALFMWLTFTTPGFSGTAKVVYIAVVYILAGIFYTGIQTAITSVLPNLTNDPNERVILNTFRMVGGNMGAFVATAFTLPLVAFFGNGNDQKGFSLTLAVYGIIAIVFFFIAFMNLREINIEKIKKIPIKQSILAIKGNWPWILLVTANLIFWIALTIRQSTLVYYLQYFIGNKDLVPLVNGLTVLQIAGMVSIPFMVKFSNKYGTMIIGLILAALGHVIMFLAGNVVSALAAGWIVASIGSGIACSMPFAMLSDTVDYGEWKNGIRASGFLTAIGSAFCIKAGSGIGGFIPAMVMDAFGYIPNVIQSAQSLMGIQIVFIWLPIFIFLLGIIPMCFYRKYEKNEAQIIREIA